MKIATWNINSIRVRIEQLLEFLESRDIDVLLLQEIKCQDKDFPAFVFENSNYNYAVFGQKSYNGVAILSRFRIEDIKLGTEVFVGDLQARYIEAFINGFSFASVYVPNGKSPDDPAYKYKIDFLNTLLEYLAQKEKFILGGDFNITMDDSDVYDPKLWKGKICCTELERSKLNEFKDLGYRDINRELNPQGELYTWWDYRRDALSKNRGLRLDYFFVDPKVSVKFCFVDKETRSKDRPSDHAPVVAWLAQS